MKIRGSGILLHVTSLPSSHGVGDMGPWAHRFADMLHACSQTYWQILPLGPTSPAIGNSPYSSCSAFAGNPLLISPERLVMEGFLDVSEIGLEANGFPRPNYRRVDYETTHAYKEKLLKIAFDRAAQKLSKDREFTLFCEENEEWLDEYVQFITLKNRFHGAGWNTWPVEFRDRDPEALERWTEEAAQEILYEQFVQYLFSRQWRALKAHCGDKSVHIIGDLPIYVTYDSADVWANPEIFKLDENKNPLFVAGVPPDYFSETGQRWGNPVYSWDTLARDGYKWWVRRMAHNLELYDYIRLDHFRGFAGYWEVPAEEETAMNGQWVDAPGQDFFTTLYRHFSCLPIIAEDLGVITPDVRELKQRFGFPGMKVLQFGFGHDLARNPDAPHNHEPNSLVYTGTHDNNTCLGWFETEASEEDKHRFLEYVGGSVNNESAHRKLLRMAMMSVANTAIFPMQDVLGLDNEARMNTPSVAKGNWEWRVAKDHVETCALDWFGHMTRFYGRGQE